MDVVKRNIADLRGEIVLSSEWQKGTTIEVILPLTLSVVDGLLVKIGDIFFVIPLSAVGKCYEVGHDYIRSQYNNLVKLDGEQVPFCYLREEFDMEGEPPLLEEIIVVEYNQMPMGLIVDEIIGEHQAVLKPLGKAFQDLNFISGGTILGDGTIALVLDTDRLVKDYAAEFNLKYNKTAKEIIK